MAYPAIFREVPRSVTRRAGPALAGGTACAAFGIGANGMVSGRAATRGFRAAWAAAVGCALAVGCATAPPVDNPVVLRTGDAIENPLLVSPGRPTPESYREVFDTVIDVLDDYFELAVADPYDGRVVTKPRFAPGYEQFWKPGNPDPRNRLHATLQSIQQTATVEIRTGDRGGYVVFVVVEKELEVTPRPTYSMVGNAIFQESPTVERQFEVVSPEVIPSRGFYKIGRDYAFEQLILRRIRNCK